MKRTVSKDAVPKRCEDYKDENYTPNDWLIYTYGGDTEAVPSQEMAAEGGDAQWTSTPDWWGQAYWKGSAGQWTRPEVAWESPPEEDIPSNVRSPSHKDDASTADATETRDWGWNPAWSGQRWSWDSWDAWDRWRSPWRWNDWNWGGGWGWGGWGGWGGWDRGWGWGNWGWGGWSGDSWRRADGWSWDRDSGWREPEGRNWWQDSRDDAQGQGWNQREGRGWWSYDSEVPEAGHEERERWEPAAPAALEDEQESTTEQNQGFGAFAAPMTAEQQEPLPGPPGPLFGETGGIRLPSIPEQPTLEEASPSAKAPAEDQPLHAHENEEWYQKWLRRQRNQPSHVVEIGAPPAAASSAPPSAAPLRPDASSASSASTAEVAEAIDPSEQRVCPDDGKTYAFEELQEAYKGEYSEEDLKGYWRDAMVIPGGATPAETSKEDYKQEEWYQKWLRRQQNKNRQIIEIG
eukprot:s58_g30.t1